MNITPIAYCDMKLRSTGDRSSFRERNDLISFRIRCRKPLITTGRPVYLTQVRGTGWTATSTSSPVTVTVSHAASCVITTSTAWRPEPTKARFSAVSQRARSKTLKRSKTLISTSDQSERFAPSCYFKTRKGFPIATNVFL